MRKNQPSSYAMRKRANNRYLRAKRVEHYHRRRAITEPPLKTDPFERTRALLDDIEIIASELGHEN